MIGLLCRNGVYRLVGAHIGPDDGTMNWGQAVLSAILLTSLAEMGLSVDKIAQAVKINVDTVREWIDGNV